MGRSAKMTRILSHTKTKKIQSGKDWRDSAAKLIREEKKKEQKREVVHPRDLEK
jgi:hypothetical protein